MEDIDQKFKNILKRYKSEIIHKKETISKKQKCNVIQSILNEFNKIYMPFFHESRYDLFKSLLYDEASMCMGTSKFNSILKHAQKIETPLKSLTFGETVYALNNSRLIRIPNYTDDIIYENTTYPFNFSVADYCSDGSFYDITTNIWDASHIYVFIAYNFLVKRHQRFKASLFHKDNIPIETPIQFELLYRNIAKIDQERVVIVDDEFQNNIKEISTKPYHVFGKKFLERVANYIENVCPCFTAFDLIYHLSYEKDDDNTRKYYLLGNEINADKKEISHHSLCIALYCYYVNHDKHVQMYIIDSNGHGSASIDAIKKIIAPILKTSLVEQMSSQLNAAVLSWNSEVIL